MNKDILLDKLLTGNFDKKAIIKMVTSLPNVTYKKIKPTSYKRGDVLFHEGFNHPCVLIKKQNDIWLACMLTSNEDCIEIVEKCNSRFFIDSHFTYTLVQVSKVNMKFISVFDNVTQLDRVYKKITERFLENLNI